MTTMAHDFGWLDLHIKGIRETIIETTKMYYDEEEITDTKVGEASSRCCNRSGLKNAPVFIHTMEDAGETMSKIVKDIVAKATEQNKNKPTVTFDKRVIKIGYPSEKNFMLIGVAKDKPIERDIKDCFDAEATFKKHLMVSLGEEKVYEIKKN